VSIFFRRVVTGDDIEIVRALATEIWREYYPAIITNEQIDYMLARMYGADVIRSELAEGVTWELAVSDTAGSRRRDEPIGYLSLGYDPHANALKLHKLYLQPRLHGQGIGRQMIEHVVAAARDLGAGRVWLQVNKHNVRAIRAYERAGFVITGELLVDIGDGFVMDDFVMARVLGEGG
jgi:ribosomal protein S18 acetylase RimI-like enzyme